MPDFDPTSKEQREHLRQLSKDGTQGPWKIQDEYETLNFHYLVNDANESISGNYDWEEGGIIKESDSLLIAESRNALEPLLSYIDELEKEARELRGLLGISDKAQALRQIMEETKSDRVPKEQILKKLEEQ